LLDYKLMLRNTAGVSVFVDGDVGCGFSKQRMVEV
jgi:hypothetical protein